MKKTMMILIMALTVYFQAEAGHDKFDANKKYVYLLQELAEIMGGNLEYKENEKTGVILLPDNITISEFMKYQDIFIDKNKSVHSSNGWIGDISYYGNLKVYMPDGASSFGLRLVYESTNSYIDISCTDIEVHLEAKRKGINLNIYRTIGDSISNELTSKTDGYPIVKHGSFEDPTIVNSIWYPHYITFELIHMDIKEYIEGAEDINVLSPWTKNKDSKGEYLIKEIKVNYPDGPGLFYTLVYEDIWGEEVVAPTLYVIWNKDGSQEVEWESKNSPWLN